MSKKIVLTGATGFIGKKLIDVFKKKHYIITVFTRDKSKGNKEIPSADYVVEWNYKNPDSFQKYIEGQDAIIHLAGANLAAKRWDEEYKKIIYNSRIVSSRSLVEAIKNSKQKPSVFISSSAVGYYGERGEETLTENSAPSGNDFLSKLCIDWENASAESAKLGIRHAAIRTGLVLSTEEGPVARMLPFFKLFIGGPLGNGKQWMPWIHADDIVNIYEFVLENEIEGAVNASSPNPVRMNEFSKVFGKFLNRPSLFPVPKFAIKLVAGELGEFVTDSQKVIPKKLLDNNFKFEFPNIEAAMKDVLKDA